jgi:predicted phage tail protein
VFSSVLDGRYDFSVRAIDAAGNTGPATSSTYELDRVSPAAPSLTSVPPTPSNDNTPAWSFTAEPGATTECRVDRGATVVSPWTPCTTPASIDLSGEPEGTYDFAVRAIDTAGNIGAPATNTYDLDRTPPAAPSIDSAPTPLDNDDNPAWSFSSEAGATFECRVDYGATIVSAWAPCTSPASFDLTAEPDGTYDVSVRATDTAGNTGPAATSTYALDRTPPAAPSIDSAPATPDNDNNPAGGYSPVPGATWECRV